MKSGLWLCVVVIVVFTASLLAQTNEVPFAKPRPQSAPGIKNFFQLSGRIYSGSTPENEDAFRELHRRGIKTIISVDGAKPDVDLAKKFGLRYVHLPIGYDGVPANRTLQLTKAAKTFGEPIFVHCHHGKHRGPAAAAVLCLGTENWTANKAEQWLKQAGTATNYTGLYQSIREFQPASSEALAAISTNFAAQVETPPMVRAMVEIDERFEHLKLAVEAGYKPPPSHPDIDPAHEALLLQEALRELLRSPEMSRKEKQFVTKMRETEETAADFHNVLRKLSTDSSETQTTQAAIIWKHLGNSCRSCHEAHRN